MKPAEEQIADAINEELDEIGASKSITKNVNRSFHGHTGMTGAIVKSLWFPPLKDRGQVKERGKRR